MRERGLEPPRITPYGPKPYAATITPLAQIGPLRFELNSHRYKQWALTHRRRSLGHYNYTTDWSGDE